MTKLLSVVVSVYNEELALREFYAETGKILKTLPADWDYEFLFVNDGSRDQSLSILREFAASDEKVKIVNFSRNFGHEAAMIAGIDYAKGDWTMRAVTVSSAWTRTCSIRRNACRRSWKSLMRDTK